MRVNKYTYLLIILLISACSSETAPITTATSAAQRKPVSLPPTWTHTVTSIPSQTPKRTSTQTFTPFPSVTPLPATPTRSPTSDAPTLTATATITPTQDTRCNINTTLDDISILPAPYINPYRVLPTLSPTTTYHAISSRAPYIEVAQEEMPLGWVDSRQRTLKIQGPGCELLPNDTRELSAFPSLCTFIPDGEIMTYKDRALSEPLQAITSTMRSVLLLKYSDVLYTSTGEPESGIFVSANQVITSGACASVPRAGLTIAETWLWSQPDAENGQQLEKIRPAQRIFIQEGPIMGPSPPSASTEGGWYFVMVGTQYNFQTGWLWSSFVFVE